VQILKTIKREGGAGKTKAEAGNKRNAVVGEWDYAKSGQRVAQEGKKKPLGGGDCSPSREGGGGKLPNRTGKYSREVPAVSIKIRYQLRLRKKKSAKEKRRPTTLMS